MCHRTHKLHYRWTNMAVSNRDMSKIFKRLFLTNAICLFLLPTNVTRDTKMRLFQEECIIVSKINVTSRRCLFANFEATLDFIRSEFTCPYNNTSRICYCGQISLQSDAVNQQSDTFGGNIYFAGDGT